MPKNVKNTTFPNPLDLIAPHSCLGCGLTGNILCGRCKKYIISQHTSICPHCKHPTTHGKCKNCPHLPPIYIAGERIGLLGNLIHDYKYHSIRALAHPLAEIMYKFLPELPKNAVIAPLPTIAKHIRSRGIDHTLLVAKHLSKLSHRPVKQLLIRNQNSVQVGTNRSARIEQADHAYIINPKFTPDPTTTYVLLDDVWTTGASMLSATKKLQQAGANHIIIALLSLSRID